MRIFGKAKDTKSSSAYRAVSTRTGVAAAEDVAMPFEHVLPDLSRADAEEMPIANEIPVIQDSSRDLAAQAGGAAKGDSDIFMVRGSSPELPAVSLEGLAAAAAAAEGVTLFVYGWENVQPGPLSWAFPSLRAALLAVRTMRNAVEWCIVSGREPSIDAARAKGAILIEQNA
jgi:hypothetical protein